MTQKRRVFIAQQVANEALNGWHPEHAVITEGNVISDVVATATLPSDIGDSHEVWNLGDVALLPGLVEVHSHMHCSATADNFYLATTETTEMLLLRSTANMRRAVLAGTTTMRDLGSPNEVAFTVRSAIERRVVVGPRLLLAGTPITITGGHCWFFGTEADSQDEVIKAVRKQTKLGAQVVKMMGTGGLFTPTSNPRQVQYNEVILRNIVAETERMGINLAVHVLSAEGVRNCANAGVHHIVHARWYGRTKGLEYDTDTVRKIVDKGLWVDPTIAHRMLEGEELQKSQKSGRQRRTHKLLESTDSPEEEHTELVRRMDAAGVRLSPGLDMGMVGGRHDDSAANAWAMHQELGWDNWRAIRAVTCGNAEALGLSGKIGRLRAGMEADMAAFTGDPAQNIRTMHRANSVVQGGVPLKINDVALV